MVDDAKGLDEVKRENEVLRQENLRLLRALMDVKSRLKEPEEIIRAIRAGEIDALVVQAEGQEEIYAVQRYDAVYRGLVEESLPYGVWLADRYGALQYVSVQFLELLQTDLVEMQEKGQFHFLPEEVREAFTAQWAQYQESGGPCDFEYTVRGRDGREHSIWTHGILAQTHDGTYYWIGINLDVTDSVKTRDALRHKAEELQDADRRKDEFIGLLGHELRNPVGVIRHGVDLLQQTGIGDVFAQQVLASMGNQTSHLARLMDDLLDVSRITAGTIQLRKEQVDLAQVINRAMEDVRPDAVARGHTLAASLPPTPVYLEADPARVEQVLVNLLGNATKYTMPGGHIYVTGDRKGDKAVISVQDNGIGIPPDMLQRIFDPFIQSDPTSDHSQGGLGIGLTLVRQLVQLHGGMVEAHSSGLGQGSEFIVRLPLATSPARQPLPSPVDQAGPTASLLRLLLVDDLEDTRRIFGRLLEVLGHQVRTAQDGPSALEAALEFRPHVVLLDVGLPGMDGYEVAQRMRQEPALENAVLVAVTGYGRQEDLKRAQEAGFDHHLVKPPDIDALEHLLATIAESTR